VREPKNENMNEDGAQQKLESAALTGLTELLPDFHLFAVPVRAARVFGTAGVMGKRIWAKPI
jgi:hypothetical protein